MPRPNETPDLVKPPEELLGEILLDDGQAQAAIQAFQAGSERWPSRLATRLGMARAHVVSGDSLAAHEAYGGVLTQLRQASPSHPGRMEALEFLEASGGVPSRVALALMPGLAPGTLPEVERRGTGPVIMIIIPCMSCRWSSFDTFVERNADR